MIRPGATLQSAGPMAPKPDDFESLLQPVLPVAYGVAMRLARQRDDAEDLVQEAAMLAFRAFHTFEIGTNFKAWYLRILTNCFFARYRKHKRRPQMVELDAAPSDSLGAEIAAAGGDLDGAALLLDRLDAEQITAALAALPEEYRAVTTLYFQDDLSYQEIATILDCPLGTVRSRLHRGRRVLQRSLWHLAREHGIHQA